MSVLFYFIKAITYSSSLFIKIILKVLYTIKKYNFYKYVKFYRICFLKFIKTKNIKNSCKKDKRYYICFLKKIKYATFYRLRSFYLFLRKNDLIDLFFICFGVFIKRFYSINLYEFDNMKKVCKKEHFKYYVVENETERTVCKPEFYNINSQECQTYISPEIYYCELKQVEIMGESSLVFYKNKCLYDAFFYDNERRYDMHFSSVRKVLKNNIVIEYIKSKRVIDKGIFMLGFASFNYYHLTVEIISRLAYIDHIEEFRGWSVIIDRVVLEVPQYRELLNAVNKYNHPIIAIESYEKVTVKNMLYISYNSWMPINVKDRAQIRVNDFMIADSAIFNLRNRLLNSVSVVRPYRKLFISRNNTKSLRLKNELQVRELFEKAGFEIIYAEELSFWKQVQYFQEAKYIVATSGGALTNIVYCQKNTVLACIIPKKFKFYMYSTIANRVGMKCIFLDAKIVEYTQYSASDVFEVDLVYCENFLEKYIKQDIQNI